MINTKTCETTNALRSYVIASKLNMKSHSLWMFFNKVFTRISTILVSFKAAATTNRKASVIVPGCEKP